jgi:hypothetical protein
VSEQTWRVSSALPREYKTAGQIKREKKENILLRTSLKACVLMKRVISKKINTIKNHGEKLHRFIAYAEETSSSILT